MHQTKKTHENWQPIHSSIDKYFDAYEGYISSHNAKKVDDQILAQLAEEISFNRIMKNKKPSLIKEGLINLV